MYTTPLSPYSELGILLPHPPLPHVDSPQDIDSSHFTHFPKRIPVKIILNDDEEVPTFENNSETTEENSLYHFSHWGGFKSKPY